MNKKLLHDKLIDWYEQNHRILPWRETDDPYKIWISEIILQQTRVAQGMEYYHRLITRFPDIQSLAEAEEDEVLLYWQGLGYYSRARNLHKAAQLMKNHEIFHQAMRLLGDKARGKEIFAALRSMPGVGDYTAGAIASFAFNLPYPALDGNVYRVLSRLYDCEIAFDTSAGKKHFHRLANQLLDQEHPRLFNSAIMEFGALYCTPTTPDCLHCPIQECCQAYAHHTVELLPVRKPRTPLRDRYLNYTIYCTPDMRTLIQQRTEKDIWQHLYEFPLQEAEALLPVAAGMAQVDLKHILSHQRIHARFHIEKVEQLPHIPNTIAIPLSALDDYALSRLTLRALDMLLV